MNILQFLLEELFGYQINAHRITFPNLIRPIFQSNVQQLQGRNLFCALAKSEILTSISGKITFFISIHPMQK